MILRFIFIVRRIWQVLNYDVQFRSQTFDFDSSSV